MRSKVQLLPRLIRLRDAHTYLGMDRNRFNAEVRPYLNEIPIGKQGIAFDRLDLDAWVDDYKVRNGRPGKKGEQKKWDVKKRRGFLSEANSTMSISNYSEEEFANQLEKEILKRRNNT